jgi:hypothetical protein
MTAAALGVATAITFLVHGMPSAQGPATAAASSPRVWAHVTFGSAAVSARRYEPKPQCRMSVLKGDIGVDPKFVLAPPPGASKHHIRIIGGELPECPTR